MSVGGGVEATTGVVKRAGYAAATLEILNHPYTKAPKQTPGNIAPQRRVVVPG